MAGQCGANADLRGLEVARLTTEDHVRSWRRKERSAAANVRPTALIDLHLVHALQVVLDGVLAVMMLTSENDRVDRRVERGCLPGTRSAP